MTNGPTYVNFAYCELGGKWNRVERESSPGNDTFEAMEDNAHINVSIFDYNKKSYYLKKGSRITIREHVLKFSKDDFSKQS